MKKKKATVPKSCVCGKELYKHGRCIFHQPPILRDRGKLYVIPIPCPNHKEGFECKLMTHVEPIAEALRPHVWNWYFINHFGIVDLAFFPKSEVANEIAGRFGFPVIDLGLLDSSDYGGSDGVSICYDALHAFSEIRLRMVRNGFKFAADSQILHYFTNQMGIDNETEGLFYTILGNRWLSRTVGKEIIYNWKWR